MTKASSRYTAKFYERQVDGSSNSAAVVVPLLLSILPVKSVVDVGCGVAPWAAEFIANGVQDVWGIDGDYVDRSQLRIPADRFLARDLKNSLNIDRTFDLAVCLEVGEHLPDSRARGLVADLTSLAPCVAFSAAIPGQGGNAHINEQYLPYWVDLFKAQGYVGIDAIRPEVLGNPSVEWWYQQNMVLFVAPGHPLLAKSYGKPQTIIHQELYEKARTSRSLRTVVRAFPGALGRSISYHIGQRLGR
jgi:SAM-dependent methyltransferase